MVFQEIDPEDGICYPSGSGYQIYQDYKRAIRDDIISEFQQIVSENKIDSNVDSLIFNSAVESLKTTTLKAINKRDYQLAIENLAIFSSLETPIDIRDETDRKGRRIDYYIDLLAQKEQKESNPLRKEMLESLLSYVENFEEKKSNQDDLTSSVLNPKNFTKLSAKELGKLNI